jgi:hypothetical protein
MRLGPNDAILDDECSFEDALALDTCLREDPCRGVVLEGCGHLHGAVVQTLLVLGPRLRGRPADAFVRDWLMPALRRHSGGLLR